MSESAFEIIKKAEEEGAKARLDAADYMRRKKEEGEEYISSLERENAKKLSLLRAELEKKETETKAAILKQSEEEWTAKKAQLDNTFEKNRESYIKSVIDKGVGIFGDSKDQ